MSATATRLATRLVCAGCGAAPAARRPVSVPLPERGPATTSTTCCGASSTPPRSRSPPTTASRTRSSATGACSTPYHQGLTDGEFCALVAELDAPRRRRRRPRLRRHALRPRRRAQRPARLLGARRRLGQGRDRQRLRLAQGAPPVRRPPLARGRRAARRSPTPPSAATSRSRAAATPRSPRRSSPPPAAARSASSSRSTPIRSSSSGSSELGADVTVCPREPGVAGDPTVHRLLEALAAGALPFTCQGDLNGLAVEGGETLGYELAAVRRRRSTALVVQVGGGALASACVAGPRRRGRARCDRLGRRASTRCRPRAPGRSSARSTRVVAPRRPRLRGAPPLGVHVAVGAASRTASPTASSTTRPTTGSPSSRGCSRRAGRPSSSARTTLAAANALAVEATGIDVDPTGSAGLAGLLALRDAGARRRRRARRRAVHRCESTQPRREPR